MLDVVYASGRAVLPQVLAQTTSAGWSLASLKQQDGGGEGWSGVQLELTGPAGDDALIGRIGTVHGVHSVTVIGDDDLE